jgi:hypothetical protein
MANHSTWLQAKWHGYAITMKAGMVYVVLARQGGMDTVEPSNRLTFEGVVIVPGSVLSVDISYYFFFLLNTHVGISSLEHGSMFCQYRTRYSTHTAFSRFPTSTALLGTL